MNKNKDFQFIKWNVYNAKVPFTTNFKKFKIRPVVIIAIIGGNVIIIPISSQIHKKNKHDIDINLHQPSLIKVANIQSIDKNDIISPFYLIQNKKIFKLNKNLKSQMKSELVKLLIK